jgi:tripartite-type tricarboxylate transporter receptor subunit TctC
MRTRKELVLTDIQRAALAAAAAAAFVNAMPASAQPYPSRPLRFIVPFAPGGTTDIVARLVAQKISDELGQQLVIDNRGGAGGVIGTDLLAKAAPDGYTIMLNHVGVAYNVTMYKTLPYDPVRDLLPISLVGVTPNVLVVTPSMAAKSVKDLVALGRAKPAQIPYGSGGVGSSAHLAVEMFQQLSGAKFLHVPYKGAGPALTDTIAGQVQFMIATMPAAAGHIRSGKLRALGVSGAKRSPAFPDLPTIAEAGVAGYEYTTWYGVLAPAKTPKPIVDRLVSATHKALTDAGLRERLQQNGMEPETNDPQQFLGLIKQDIARWAKIIRAAGIQPQ